MDKLRRSRERLGWSRAELARRAGMSPSTVGQIESGRLLAYPSQIKKLARALGLSPRQLRRAGARRP
jgi:transcriptional regulator with XRE-family HTH domain